MRVSASAVPDDVVVERECRKEFCRGGGEERKTKRSFQKGPTSKLSAGMETRVTPKRATKGRGPKGRKCGVPCRKPTGFRTLSGGRKIER